MTYNAKEVETFILKYLEQGACSHKEILDKFSYYRGTNVQHSLNHLEKNGDLIRMEDERGVWYIPSKGREDRNTPKGKDSVDNNTGEGAL